MAKMESVWKESSDAGNYDQVRPDYPKQVVDVSINYLTSFLVKRVKSK